MADSLALREFLGLGLSERMPDHSTISRNRRLIDLETHQEIFAWVQATYANHRRMKGARGKRLARWRSEKVERTMAHSYETGGLRRVHLREHRNILKRALIHIAGGLSPYSRTLRVQVLAHRSISGQAADTGGTHLLAPNLAFTTGC